MIAFLGRGRPPIPCGDHALDRLLRSGARFAHSAVVLTAYERGEATKVATRQLGPALAFERLWQETGCRRVIGELAGERGFQFDLATPLRSILRVPAARASANTATRRTTARI